MDMVLGSVLDPQRHARLIADMEHVCITANVPKKFVHTSMKDVCSAREIDWVVNFRTYRGNVCGLVLDGLSDPDTRCMAICGALVRNFIDARIVPLNTLLDAVEEKNVPDPTVMIIPNLYVSQVGKALPAWKIQGVYDLLLARRAADKPTVMAVESMTGLQSAYGLAFSQHLNHQYQVAS